ncbi:hypothetical protein CR66_01630 [Campylobacter mucosalis]|nr:hypothetical protein CR66_01630 [Campylobacter mucosalis]
MGSVFLEANMLSSYLLYVMALGILGSLVGFTKSDQKGLKAFSYRLIDGVFSAYIAYEIAFYFLQNERLCMAICATAAWFGSDLLVEIRDIIISAIKAKIGTN